VLAGLDTTSLKRGIRTEELAITTAQLAVTTAEIELKLTEDSIAAAKIDLEQATDSLRKITYPYTYSTFFFDVPEALVAIRDAERQLKEAQNLAERMGSVFAKERIRLARLGPALGVHAGPGILFVALRGKV